MRTACFDLDGTIIDGDSFRLFIGYLVRTRRIGRRWVPVLAAVYALRRSRLISLLRAKELMLRPLAGSSRRHLDEIGDAFFESELRPRLRSGMVASIREHQQNGDRVIIATSAPDVYLNSIARFLGVTDAWGTRLVFDAGVFTGHLGPHLFGSAKVASLREAIGDRAENSVTFCYADHHSDLPLLEVADHAFAVAPTRRLRDLARERGWPILD